MEINMKYLVGALLGVALIASSPVYAATMLHRSNPPSQHYFTGHSSNHKVTYRRTYKTDAEEHRQTENLNRLQRSSD